MEWSKNGVKIVPVRGFVSTLSTSNGAISRGDFLTGTSQSTPLWEVEWSNFHSVSLHLSDDFLHGNRNGFGEYITKNHSSFETWIHHTSFSWLTARGQGIFVPKCLVNAKDQIPRIINWCMLSLILICYSGMLEFMDIWIGMLNCLELQLKHKALKNILSPNA